MWRDSRGPPRLFAREGPGGSCGPLEFLESGTKLGETIFRNRERIGTKTKNQKISKLRRGAPRGGGDRRGSEEKKRRFVCAQVFGKGTAACALVSARGRYGRISFRIFHHEEIAFFFRYTSARCSTFRCLLRSSGGGGFLALSCRFYKAATGPAEMCSSNTAIRAPLGPFV